MNIGRIACAAAVVLLWPCVAPAQSGPAAVRSRTVSAALNSAALQSIERWKTAVIAGDQSALAALYTMNPPSQTQIDQGTTQTTQDPREEPRFWSSLAPNGLRDFQTKILAIEPRPEGSVEIVLRVLGKVHTTAGEQGFLVEVHQLWAQEGGDWRIFATRRSGLASSPVMRLPEPAKPNTSLYPPPVDAKAEIRTALASAARDHKRVILIFGANWCYDCHVLDATFRSKDIAPLVNANYHVVHISVGPDGNQNLDLATQYGVPLKESVRLPSLAVLDPDGKVVYSQKNGEFDDTTKLGPTDIVGFLKRWAPRG